MKPVSLPNAVEEARWTVRFLAGLACAAIGGAVYRWFVPASPPFKGHLAWVAELTFALGGNAGLVFLWLAFAFAMLVLAKFAWRHAPRVPGDRW
jgi:uncharacterized RDD family membrane protein YckC